MSQVSIEWSNSSLTALERCGEKFRRRYIEREKVPPSPRMLRGTVVHKVASATMLRKLEKEDVPSVEESKDLAATEFEQQWAGGVSLGEEPVEGGLAGEKARSKDFAVDVSAAYVKGVAPRVEPVAVERHIVVRPKDSDLVIHGTIDLIAKAPAYDPGNPFATAPAPGTAPEVIRDLKTSEKTPAKDTAERSQQLTMYAMVREAEVGALPQSLALDYVVRTPVQGQIKHVLQETTRDRGDVTALVHRLNTAVEAVKRGVFVPTAPDSWWCSPNWCEYFQSCVYVKRGIRPRD